MPTTTTTTTTTGAAPVPCRVCGAPVDAERAAAVGPVCYPRPYSTALDGEPMRCAVVGTVNGATTTEWTRRDSDGTAVLGDPDDETPVFRGDPADEITPRVFHRASAPARRSDAGNAVRAALRAARRAAARPLDPDTEEMMRAVGGTRAERVPVDLDGATWAVGMWSQDDEHEWAESAERAAAVFRAVWAVLTGAALPVPERPVLWRGPVVLGGAGAERTGPFTFTTADGERVTVADFPLPIDSGDASRDVARGQTRGRGAVVRAAATPAVVGGKGWPAYGPRYARQWERAAAVVGPLFSLLTGARWPYPARPFTDAQWSASGLWMLAPGEYPCPVDLTAPLSASAAVNGGTAGRATATSGRLPRRARAVVGEDLGTEALANMVARFPERADALRAVPVPVRTGDAAADRRAATRYRAALRRRAGLK